MDIDMIFLMSNKFLKELFLLLRHRQNGRKFYSLGHVINYQQQQSAEKNISVRASIVSTLKHHARRDVSRLAISEASFAHFLLQHAEFLLVRFGKYQRTSVKTFCRQILICALSGLIFLRERYRNCDLSQLKIGLNYFERDKAVSSLQL